ncbi:MAG: type II secretion system protein N [Burkholderiales bacterium]|nr:MAG: type II secretion system protein N [Burkholderiales bacterium]
METVWPRRMGWLALLLGLLVALVLFAPARWLAGAVTGMTDGRLQLLNARGSLWDGQADVVLTGGSGSQTSATLPQGIRWRLRPAWEEGSPALRLALQAPCCTADPLLLSLRGGISSLSLHLAASRSHWPADLLAGLGTPWNTLRLEGRLQLQTDGFAARWNQGRLGLQGGIGLDAFDLSSRLSPLRPLGSYRLELRAASDGHTGSLSLSTLSGALQLRGEGQWVGSRLRFEGVAEAEQGREMALTNLLNIIGRRDGTRSLLRLG